MTFRIEAGLRPSTSPWDRDMYRDPTGVAVSIKSLTT
jgi:hypothetical protein